MESKNLSSNMYIYIEHICSIYIYIFELRFFDSIEKVGPNEIRIYDLVLTVHTI